jgi:hypothetical protein
LHQRFLSALLLALAAQAALAQPMRGAGGAATRPNAHYRDLEIALQDAIATRDAPAVLSRVSPQFEFRTPASADSLDRAAWLKAQERRSVRIRDVSVREEGEMAVVSFLADAPRGTRFVVDVWKGDQLVARYAARAQEAARAPVRPTGRD